MKIKFLSPIDVSGTSSITVPNIKLTSILPKTTETAIAYLTSGGTIVSGVSTGGGTITGGTNGLRISGANIALGGELTGATDISGTYDLTFGSVTPLLNFQTNATTCVYLEAGTGATISKIGIDKDRVNLDSVGEAARIQLCGLYGRIILSAYDDVNILTDKNMCIRNCSGFARGKLCIDMASGATYAGDYSSRYTARSLVDKAYVTGQTASIGNKLDTSIYQTYTGTTAPATFASKSAYQTYTGTTAPATFANKSSVNYYTGTTAPAKYLPFTMATDMQDPTGFVDGNNINIKYTYSARTITLTGTLDYYWNGVKHTLSSPWTSAAHTASVGHWYLYSTDGTNISWSNSLWAFNNMMVAHVYYKSTSGATYGVRETHGLMPWQVHEDLHQTIGTYLQSGGLATTNSWTANTANSSAVSPSFNSAVIDDEDLETTIASLTKGAYTLMYVSGSTSVYTLANPIPFLPNSVAFISVNTPSTGVMTAGVTNRYYNVYQILVPTTSDATSQKYRMIFLAPQATYTTLAAAQAEDTRGLSFGALSDESAEYIIYARITYLTANANGNNGKVTIPTGGITYVVGTRMSSTSVAGVSASNHATLSNLTWANSGHVGTNSSFAAFDSNGDACNALRSSMGSFTGSTICATSCVNSTLINVNSPATSSRDLNVGANGIYSYGNIQMPNDKAIYIGLANDTGTRYKIFTTSCHAYFDYYDCLCFRSGPVSSLYTATLSSGGTLCVNQAVCTPIVCATTCFVGSGAGLTGTASSLTANNASCLGGIPANGIVQTAGYSISTLGWARIATLSNYVSYGTISISNNYNNYPPSPIIFNFGTTYRNAGYITQIGGNNSIFTKARIVYATTGNTDYYIEVYHGVSLGNTYYIKLSDSIEATLIGSYTAGSIPASYGSNELTFTSNGGISTTGIVCASTCFAGSGAGLTGTASSLTANNSNCFGGIPASYYVYGQNGSATCCACASTYCSGSTPMYKSGFWEVTGSAWTPTTDWYWGGTFAHSSNSPTYNYGMQLIGRGTGADVGCNFYLRTISAGVPTSWKRIYVSGDTVGGGMTWSGTTNDALGTYRSSTCIVAEPNLTFNGSSLGLTANIGFVTGADRCITWNATSSGTGSALCICGNNSPDGSDGGAISLHAGSAGGSSECKGGALYLCAGNGFNGGDVYIIAPNTNGAGTAGSINICAGVSGSGCGNVCIVGHTNAASRIKIMQGTNNVMIAVPASCVELYYNNAAKLCTVTNGICLGANCGFGTDFVATSDIRLKKDIIPISDALSMITQLQGICYHLCDDCDCEMRVGLIAQDVEKIIPEVVSHSAPSEEDAKYGITDEKLGLKYDKLTAVLIEAIKEQQIQINLLQQEINEIKNK